jgi:hypothetical protein
MGRKSSVVAKRSCRALIARSFGSLESLVPVRRSTQTDSFFLFRLRYVPSPNDRMAKRIYLNDENDDDDDDFFYGENNKEGAAPTSIPSSYSTKFVILPIPVRYEDE